MCVLVIYFNINVLCHIILLLVFPSACQSVQKLEKNYWY